MATRQQLPEQHGFYFNEEQGIPRRRSAGYQGIAPPPQQQKRQQNTNDDTAFRMPASQLRHRPIGQHSLGEGTLTRGGDGSLIFTSLSGKQVVLQRGIPQDIYAHAATRQQYSAPYTEEEDITTTPGAALAQIPIRRQRRRIHWMLIFGVGMICMLALWVVGTTVVSAIGHKLDDMTYGYPRTWQTDAVVGHNGDSSATPSHFIFLNLNGHVEVIEQPAGDASKAKIYYGPSLYSDDANLIPVTGEFKDVNHDGKPDMIIKIQDSHIVFINENGGFRPLKPGEKVTMPAN